MFISLEGIDGAGKSTVAEAIAEELPGEVMLTSEPTDNWTGRQVRRALSSSTPEFVDFFLFMADRTNHIENLIRPVDESGGLVISDRYADSTYAYQSVQLGDSLDNPIQWMKTVMAPWNYEPDITIFIDISVNTALERADGEEKYETRDMLEQVQENYYDLLNAEQERFIVVDGEQPQADVIDEVVGIVKEIYA